MKLRWDGKGDVEVLCPSRVFPSTHWILDAAFLRDEKGCLIGLSDNTVWALAWSGDAVGDEWVMDWVMRCCWKPAFDIQPLLFSMDLSMTEARRPDALHHGSDDNDEIDECDRSGRDGNEGDEMDGMDVVVAGGTALGEILVWTFSSTCANTTPQFVCRLQGHAGAVLRQDTDCIG